MGAVYLGTVEWEGLRARRLVVGPDGMARGDPYGGKHASVGCAAYAMRMCCADVQEG